MKQAVFGFTIAMLALLVLGATLIGLGINAVGQGKGMLIITLCGILIWRGSKIMAEAEALLGLDM